MGYSEFKKSGLGLQQVFKVCCVSRLGWGLSTVRNKGIFLGFEVFKSSNSP